MGSAATVSVVVLVLAVFATLLIRVARIRRDFGSPEEIATFETLHQASLAAPLLRGGLAVDEARKAVRHLRALLGDTTAAVALTDEERLLVWEGTHGRHAEQAMDHAREALRGGRTTVVGPDRVACVDPDCEVRHAVVAPLIVEERVVGTLAAYGPGASASRIRATSEVARWVSSQLELAELDRSRTRLMEAELRALRTQISPHFVYNSLTVIASLVRTDPKHARELLLEFADFTRYSFRRQGEFTTLAEELRAIDRYLMLERARFGDRLSVTLEVAPEVLPVTVPFLCLQPIVENAVRHGLADKDGQGHVTIIAENSGSACVISVEDDGLGMDPEHLRRALGGEPGSERMGLANVDERLRGVFGDDHGLVVETGPGAGTKVSMTVPKYKAGVHAS